MMGKIQVDLDNIGSADGSKEKFSTVVYADRIDLLRARSDILTGKDKALMKMYLEKGSTFAQMAQLAGVNEATIARRIHKLMRKLLDGEYITCLRNHVRFSPLEQAIAKDYFLEDCSQKKVALKRNVSVYRIRKTLRKVQELVNSN